MSARSYPRVFVALVASVVLLTGTTQAQTTWYVDDDAPLGGDGSSWGTAFKYLQDALGVASNGDGIRVGRGTYRPDQDEAGNVIPGDRMSSFVLVSGVRIFGGYRGVGTDMPGDPNDHDPDVFETVLSGDLAGDDGPGFENDDENTYHVVWAYECDETAVLDGFTITAGNANRPYYPDERGGGLKLGNSDLSISNCLITQNSAEELV